MEIHYDTTVTYGVDVEVEDYKALAKLMGVSVAKLRKIIENGELDEHEEAVQNWMGTLPPERISVLDESPIENLVYHYETWS